jgi:transposase
MGTSKDLSGKLPIHFQPKEDELLSSWICRLALAHGADLASFNSTIMPAETSKRAVICRDIDRRTDSKLIITLAEKAGAPVDRVFASTLAAYGCSLFEQLSHRDRPVWFTPIWSNLPFSIRPGLQYCPLCLDQEEPYYRRKWRLACITICTEHNVHLLDRCAMCSAPISFQKAISNGPRQSPSARMTFCYSCKSDLRRVRLESAGHHEVSFQQLVERALDKGWVEMPGIGALYSMLFFPVLHQLMRLVAIGERSASLRKSISQRYGIELFEISFPKKLRKVAHLNVCERRGVLALTRRLLDYWPDVFVEFCITNRIYSNDLFSEHRQYPFWFSSVVDEHLRRPVYTSPREEIESAVVCLKKMERRYRHCGQRPDEMRVVSRFLSKGPARKRNIRKSLQPLVTGGNEHVRPNPMPDPLWRKVMLLINSHYKFLKMEPERRRKLLNGVLFVLYTGCSWQAMPNKFGSPAAARSMYVHLNHKGILEQVWELCSDLYNE